MLPSIVIKIITARKSSRWKAKLFILSFLFFFSIIILNSCCFFILQSLEEGDEDDKFLGLLRSTIQCLTRPELYFVDVLRSAIKKTGTDEGPLTRIVTTRAEIDLKVIGQEYQRRNSIPLEKIVNS